MAIPTKVSSSEVVAESYTCLLYTSKNYSAVFGSQKAFYPAEPFEGAECSAVFGGVELDLRAAIIEKDVVIDVSAVFGGITIYLPTTVKVVTHNTPIFGGMSCKRLMMGELPENAPTVYVSGVCAFGGDVYKRQE